MGLTRGVPVVGVVVVRVAASATAGALTFRRLAVGVDLLPGLADLLGLTCGVPVVSIVVVLVGSTSLARLGFGGGRGPKEVLPNAALDRMSLAGVSVCRRTGF